MNAPTTPRQTDVLTRQANETEQGRTALTLLRTVGWGRPATGLNTVAMMLWGLTEGGLEVNPNVAGTDEAGAMALVLALRDDPARAAALLADVELDGLEADEAAAMLLEQALMMQPGEDQAA